jgi:hypothetical protein
MVFHINKFAGNIAKIDCKDLLASFISNDIISSCPINFIFRKLPGAQ